MGTHGAGSPVDTDSRAEQGVSLERFQVKRRPLLEAKNVQEQPHPNLNTYGVYTCFCFWTDVKNSTVGFRVKF